MLKVIFICHYPIVKQNRNFKINLEPNQLNIFLQNLKKIFQDPYYKNN